MQDTKVVAAEQYFYLVIVLLITVITVGHSKAHTPCTPHWYMWQIGMADQKAQFIAFVEHIKCLEKQRFVISSHFQHLDRVS